MTNPRIVPTLSNLDVLRLECAVNEALRDRFLKDPEAVLAERGIPVPEGVKIKVAEESPDTHVVTLPPFVGGDLSDEALLKAASGGGQGCTYCTLCTLTSVICFGSLVSLMSLREADFANAT